MSRELVTTFLDRWQRDQGADAAEILPAIYDELRALARSYLARERVDHTLQPTALVHEAYLRLVDQERVSWRGRNHFLAVAAIAMRRLLVDHARGRRRDKRGGDAPKLSLTAAMPVADEDAMADEIVAVDDLLQTLAGFDARAAEVVQCRYFGGLTIEETAAALGLSPMTVKRSWQTARAWLRKELAARNQG